MAVFVPHCQGQTLVHCRIRDSHEAVTNYTVNKLNVNVMSDQVFFYSDPLYLLFAITQCSLIVMAISSVSHQGLTALSAPGLSTDHAALQDI